MLFLSFFKQIYLGFTADRDQIAGELVINIKQSIPLSQLAAE
jgi:hypothetical protein